MKDVMMKSDIEIIFHFKERLKERYAIELTTEEVQKLDVADD
jgi:hypothetical protein